MCFISLSPNKYIGFMGPPHEVSIYRICTKAFNKCPCWYRVKSGNFRYQVKSDSDLICFIWISTACKYMSKFTWSPNLHDFTLFSEDRVLNCGLSLHLYQYFVYASSVGSGESAHMRILAWVSVALECDKFPIFHWLAKHITKFQGKCSDTMNLSCNAWYESMWVHWEWHHTNYSYITGHGWLVMEHP